MLGVGDLKSRFTKMLQFWNGQVDCSWQICHHDVILQQAMIIIASPLSDATTSQLMP